MARPLAVKLGVTQKHPQGTLIVGAHGWARQIALAIKEAGFDVWLVDTNSRHIDNAGAVGLSGFHDSIMADGILDELPMECIGRLLALTDNDELNTLAAIRYSQWLGNDHVFQLITTRHKKDHAISEGLRGHTLFREEMSFRDLEELYFQHKEVILLKENAADTLTTFSENNIFALVLFVVTNDDDRRLLVSTADEPLMPRPDQAAIALVDSAAGGQLISKYMEATPMSTL